MTHLQDSLSDCEIRIMQCSNECVQKWWRMCHRKFDIFPFILLSVQRETFSDICDAIFTHGRYKHLLTACLFLQACTFPPNTSLSISCFFCLLLHGLQTFHSTLYLLILFTIYYYSSTIRIFFIQVTIIALSVVSFESR